MTAVITRSIFRYVVPVDGSPHVIALSHSPVAVAAVGSAGDSVVEFWCEHTDDGFPVKRAFQVFGTGWPLPDDARWIGTCPRTADGLVWHLYEMAPQAEWDRRELARWRMMGLPG